MHGSTNHTHGFRARAIGFLLSLSLSRARARVHADAAGARMQQVLLPLLFLLKGRVLAAPHAGLQAATGYTDEQLSGVLKNETAYIQWQGSKTLDNPSWIQSVDRRVEQFVRQQYAKEDVRGRTVLCIGARGGGEVRAFRTLGAFAVGIDLEPAIFAHDIVLRANALKLPFASGTVDRVFTNVLDHIPDLPKFCAEVARVLRPGGHLIADVMPQLRSQDEWSVRDTGTPEFYRDFAAAMDKTGMMRLAELVQRMPNRTVETRRITAQDRVRWVKHQGHATALVRSASSVSELREDAPETASTLNASPTEQRFGSHAFLFPHALTNRHVDTRRLEELCASTALSVKAIGIDMKTKLCGQQLPNASVTALIETAAADNVAPAMFAYDFLHHVDSCAVTRPHSLDQHLHDHGWATVDDWGLDLNALKQQSFAILDPIKKGAQARAPFISLKNPDIPALHPILGNSSLGALLKAYLGGPVRYDGHVLLHVSPRANPQNYVSSHWHHDRCGSRIKVFIFLHDVVQDGSELRPPRLSNPWSHTHLLTMARLLS
jgi:SAM-dependent methyltransferase